MAIRAQITDNEEFENLGGSTLSGNWVPLKKKAKLSSLAEQEPRSQPAIVARVAFPTISQPFPSPHLDVSVVFERKEVTEIRDLVKRYIGDTVKFQK